MRECVNKETRSPLDFYRTPKSAIEAILPYLSLDGFILEPSAGDGAIVRVLLDAGVSRERIHGVEINAPFAEVASAFCRVESADFLEWRAPRRFDLVIGNPPYCKAMEFVEKALKVGDTVAMLLRLGFLESKARSGFHRSHPADVFVFAKRPCFTGRSQTYPAPFAWFVWGPGRGNRWGIL